VSGDQIEASANSGTHVKRSNRDFVGKYRDGLQSPFSTYDDVAGIAMHHEKRRQVLNVHVLPVSD
jgi:hypothetical protein